MHFAGGEVTHRYDAVFKGFAAKLTDQQLQGFQANLAAGDSPIDYIGASRPALRAAECV